MSAAPSRPVDLGYLANLAYVVVFFAFMLAPIVVVVVISVSSKSNVSFPIEGVTLRWFVRIFEYKPFVNSFLLSLNIAVVSALCAAAVGVPAALALARSTSAWAMSAMTFLLSPLAIPAIVIGFSLLFFMGRIGIGISYWSLLIGHVVASIPYVVRTVAGLYRSLSSGLESVAATLGASRWQVFRYVTFPLILPGIFAGMVYAMLISIDNLPISFFFGGASTNTLPVVMLSYIEYQLDPSIAAVSVVQLLFAVVALFVVDRFFGLGRLI